MTSTGLCVEFGRKLPTVPLALLKLSSATPRPLAANKITAALWPGMAADASRGPLDTAVYRLRIIPRERRRHCSSRRRHLAQSHAPSALDARSSRGRFDPSKSTPPGYCAEVRSTDESAQPFAPRTARYRGGSRALLRLAARLEQSRAKARALLDGSPVSVRGPVSSRRSIG